MKDKLQKKLEQKMLYDKLQHIYKELCDIEANMGFLYNYCKAYSHLDGVYYFVPFTTQLRKSIMNITKEFYELLGNEEKDLKPDYFLDNIKPLNKMDYQVLDEDF